MRYWSESSARSTATGTRALCGTTSCTLDTSGTCRLSAGERERVGERVQVHDVRDVERSATRPLRAHRGPAHVRRRPRRHPGDAALGLVRDRGQGGVDLPPRIGGHDRVSGPRRRVHEQPVAVLHDSFGEPELLAPEERPVPVDVHRNSVRSRTQPRSCPSRLPATHTQAARPCSRAQVGQVHDEPRPRAPPGEARRRAQAGPSDQAPQPRPGRAVRGALAPQRAHRAAVAVVHDRLGREVDRHARAGGAGARTRGPPPPRTARRSARRRARPPGGRRGSRRRRSGRRRTTSGRLGEARPAARVGQPLRVEPVDLERPGHAVVLAQGVAHRAHPPGRDHVVGVARGDRFRGRRLEADVARVARTVAVRRVDEPHAWEPRRVVLDQRDRSVGGAVVHHDDLPLPVPVLGQERVELVAAAWPRRRGRARRRSDPPHAAPRRACQRPSNRPTRPPATEIQRARPAREPSRPQWRASHSQRRPSPSRVDVDAGAARPRCSSTGPTRAWLTAWSQSARSTCGTGSARAPRART